MSGRLASLCRAGVGWVDALGREDVLEFLLDLLVQIYFEEHEQTNANT